MTAATKPVAKIRETRSDRIFNAVNTAFWIVVLAIVLYPLYLILIASVSDPDAVMMGRVLFKPVDFSLIGYEAVFRHRDLWNSYVNAIFYTLAGSALSLVVTLMAAYGLSRRFLAKGLFNFLIVFTMFFTGGLIPTFITLKDMGLYNTRIIMVIINCVSVWNLMVARTYIKTTLPEDLYEAAVVDGATHFVYFFRIVLPLSGTIIAVLSVYYGVARWNDYFTALVYIRDRVKLPLQTILREVLASLTTSTSSDAFFSAYANDTKGMTDAMRKAAVAKYCCIVVSTAPAVLLYIFMQKYFVKGVMIGSLKG
ncbi:MAG: carbohydrate ABC transporter permease [Oscillospiraceae bacterium]|jgi:putative aldouronate transport system permease protein|nr:carbohydrate ABC transporter permease [Oscillospiraceae bacterium]